MSLPIGTWKATVNGTEGTLILNAPDAKSVITGAMLGKGLTGFWDEVSQTITFSVFIRAGGTDADQVLSFALFTGYLLRVPTNPEQGRDVVATLSGSFTMTIASTRNPPFPDVVTSRRNVFGWFAQITEIL
jgi:hypothetical protein